MASSRSGEPWRPPKGILEGPQRLKSCLDTVHGKMLAFVLAGPRNEVAPRGATWEPS